MSDGKRVKSIVYVSRVRDRAGNVKNETCYLQRFKYSDSGELDKSIFERRPSDGRNRVLEGAAYVSSGDYSQIRREIELRKLSVGDFNLLSNLNRIPFDRKGGRIIRWEVLENGRLIFKKSGLVEEIRYECEPIPDVSKVVFEPVN